MEGRLTLNSHNLIEELDKGTHNQFNNKGNCFQSAKFSCGMGMWEVF